MRQTIACVAGFLRGRSLRPFAAMAALACLATAATAQTAAAPHGGWKPERPIKIIVPYPPGGGTDVTARLLANALKTSRGYAVVVENRPGANGIIATRTVHAAAPDGYTLMLVSSDTHAVNPHLYPDAAPLVADMTPVSAVARVPVMLIGHKKLPAKDARQLVEKARASEMTYAHYGIGSNGQISMEIFKAAAQIPAMLGVPYQGGGPAMQAVVAGEVDVAVVPMNTALAQGGNVIYYGTLSAQRPLGAEHIPTIREQGINAVADSWVGIYAPPKTAPQIADALSQAIRDVVRADDFGKRLVAQGLAPFPLDGRMEFERFVADESKRFANVIRQAGIKASN